jgi:predicted nucleic acid-binding Zn ribbon protein
LVENENLKREVDELTHALGKAYGGEARFLKCLGSQRFSLNKEGLCYTPKKDKAAFATHKPSFVKSNGQFCNRCKEVGHLEHNWNKMNKNKKMLMYLTFIFILVMCLPRVRKVCMLSLLVDQLWAQERRLFGYQRA